MLIDQLQALYKIGIPYSTIAKKVGADRSTISKFANGTGTVSFELDAKIQIAIEQLKEDITNV